MLQQEKLVMFENRLTKVFKHRSKLAKRQNISCYRIYDHDIPEFPFAIELYDEKIYLAEYLRRHGMEDDEHEEWLQASIDIICKILDTDEDKIYSRQRNRKAGRQGQYQRIDQAKEFFTVEENGLKFLINLTDYLDTGLFLDHRTTRKILREQVTNKRVLNLFCYTGSFSVYAAAGNASTVTSVDLSKTYLQWAEDNFELNNFKDQSKYFFVHADVKQYLKTLKPDSFDLVIMDPPTFSNSKRMKDFLDIQIDHAEMINDVLKALTPGGIIYFSTNYTKFVLDKEEIKATSIKDITKQTIPFDFEGKLKRWCYLIQK
ncbi:MAG: methyltransferase protein [Chitinophagaceae bacterium]|nr:methyltransferase protein [Chitinophagaceae bacterium]